VLYAGRTLLRCNISIPTPLTQPKKEGTVVDAETAQALDQKSFPEPVSGKPTDES
jgi:hypothetical protein